MLIPIVGAVGRIVWGTLGDKMSLRKLFVSGNALSTLLQVFDGNKPIIPFIHKLK